MLTTVTGYVLFINGQELMFYPVLDLIKHDLQVY